MESEASPGKITRFEIEQKPTSTPDPRGTSLRWIALILASLLVPANDYCYDLPQALQTQIQDTLEVNETQFNLLYSLYSIPNIFLPFVGGFILDYFGINVGLVLYTSVTITGQTLYTIGSYSHSFFLLVLGRIILGVGAESLNVAQSTIITMWFKGREQTFALGFSLSLARVGSAINSALTPDIYDWTGSLGLCSLVGLLCVVASATPVPFLISMQKKYLAKYDVETEVVSLKDLKTFNASIWLLYFNAIICFWSYFSFFNIANQYFQVRFGFSASEAGNLLIIPYSMAMLLTPAFGVIIDRIGKRATLMIGACGLLVTTHFVFAVTPECNECYAGVLGLVLMGLFISLHLSLLLPSAMVVAPHSVLGSAFGLITSGMNTGLAVGPLVAGYLLDTARATASVKDSYLELSEFLIGLSVVALAGAIANYIWDARKNNSALQAAKTGVVEPGHDHSPTTELTDTSRMELNQSLESLAQS